MDDDDLPKARRDAAAQLALESLDPYSREELDARITLLETEIVRVRRHREMATSHLAAAEALFRSGKT